ncbi:hypothetical protein RhiirA1_440135 [Rhizophagus irregularis]|nr:hypothetical protein GLOIN_2v1631037 [Rhizophagus irregularis DAOM 181602=DAOM 197198]EXX61904.1 hypothetical protein RirG_166840 [Rhizophagus irregularis DAOM 197198w]PKC69242.1 hypothetical protein RhiirA1_440135 [Rhizophagus irregularis]POG69017.1 hypothetical protein GLOIN_2v1631037 [Rhizophagus irregularis DAOM 181602=DAOM 197198]|eukprot:XP_025175883.1 hypothetical protein GLOIN_2v1631037 [Rhizophagus irregularis DAOM 181602=DAOM 197198]
MPTPVATTSTFTVPSNIPEKIVVDEENTPPPNTTQVQLKFSAQLPWLQVVGDDVLPSQFVKFVPEDIAKFTGIPLKDITVTDLQAADNGGVLMTINIPENKFGNLSNVIANPSSAFYLKGTELSKLVDPSSPIVVSGDNVPNPTNLGFSGGNSNRGIIIGLAVGGSTILYAGLTALIIRAYKKKNSKKMQRQENHVYGSTNGNPYTGQ